MGWVKLSEVPALVARLREVAPELAALGAGEVAEVRGEYGWLGDVRFPSGVKLSVAWGLDGRAPVVHLFGEMDLPFAGFDEAARLAPQIAENCGYVAGVNRRARSLDIYGPEGAFLVLYGQRDTIADVHPLRP